MAGGGYAKVGVVRDALRGMVGCSLCKRPAALFVAPAY